jgi:hypothetical protein
MQNLSEAGWARGWEVPPSKSFPGWAVDRQVAVTIQHADLLHRCVREEEKALSA